MPVMATHNVPQAMLVDSSMIILQEERRTVHFRGSQVFTIRNEGLRPEESVPLSESMIRSLRNFRKKLRMLVVS
jgi:hypothetical protein